MLNRTLLSGLLLSLLLNGTAFPEERKMDGDRYLTAKQRHIVTIAAFTANGDTEKLKGELTGGLDAGMTVNEIKEILIQMYAYAGFPRSLNGIQAFLTVMDERKGRGIRDYAGR